MIFDPDSAFDLDPSVVIAPVGEEGVALDLRDGVYYGLNPVAIRTWQLAGSGASLGAIEAALLSEFDVEPSVLAVDLRALLTDLSERGLLRVRTT